MTHNEKRINWIQEGLIGLGGKLISFVGQIKELLCGTCARVHLAGSYYGVCGSSLEGFLKCSTR